MTDIEHHVKQVRDRIEEIHRRVDAIGLPEQEASCRYLLKEEDATERQARWKFHVLDAARGADVAKPLYEEAERIGLKEDWRGVSCTTKKQWKQAIEEHHDPEYCRYLLDVIIDWNLEFWTYYHLCAHPDDLIELVEAGDIDYGSTKNVVKTWLWLDKQGVPSSKPARQQRIAELMG